VGANSGYLEAASAKNADGKLATAALELESCNACNGYNGSCREECRTRRFADPVQKQKRKSQPRKTAFDFSSTWVKTRHHSLRENMLGDSGLIRLRGLLSPVDIVLLRTWNFIDPN
jgi:hypothetical protein